jgi:hypothetical protein
MTNLLVRTNSTYSRYLLFIFDKIILCEFIINQDVLLLFKIDYLFHYGKDEIIE